MATVVSRIQALHDGGDGVAFESFDALHAAKQSLVFSNYGERDVIQKAFDPTRGFGRLYSIVVKKQGQDLVLYYKWVAAASKLACLHLCTNIITSKLSAWLCCHAIAQAHVPAARQGWLPEVALEELCQSYESP